MGQPSQKNEGDATFENFVQDTLSSRIKFTHSIQNSDVDIRHEISL